MRNESPSCVNSCRTAPDYSRQSLGVPTAGCPDSPPIARRAAGESRANGVEHVDHARAALRGASAHAVPRQDLADYCGCAFGQRRCAGVGECWRRREGPRPCSLAAAHVGITVPRHRVWMTAQNFFAAMISDDVPPRMS